MSDKTSAQQDEREAWRQRAESMRNVAGDNALRVPPETMLALLAHQVQADAGAVDLSWKESVRLDAIIQGSACTATALHNARIELAAKVAKAAHPSPAAESDKSGELLARAVAICQEEGDEWDSDNLVTDKNYAHACRDRIAAMSREQSGGGE